MSTPVVLSIGTTHPWNIAGVGLDAQVAAEFGLRSATVVVGVTAQDHSGVRDRFAVPPEVVRAQFESIPRDHLAAIRVGAVFDEQNVGEVARFLCGEPEVPAVVDPIFTATLGGNFGGEASFAAFRVKVMALPVILTPNIPEAERLTGRTISNKEQMISAAHALRAMGPRAVLLKGGHLAGDPLDVLVTAHETKVFTQTRLAQRMRGTGCTLAAALACELAKGRRLEEAVDSARAYVRKKIEAQIPYASLHVAF
ncbi:MAG: hydroxymethylpyrimidine/phosphomethylpyrimidine kinase [Candidatus Baltobacteraceae bacterium]